ncbi:MAG: class I SAM-dependent methyltransferase [Acetobacteraceae bacterium]
MAEAGHYHELTEGSPDPARQQPIKEPGGQAPSQADDPEQSEHGAKRDVFECQRNPAPAASRRGLAGRRGSSHRALASFGVSTSATQVPPAYHLGVTRVHPGIGNGSWPMSGAKPTSTRPHPLLSDYYATVEDRAGFVREIFDRTASRYDRINRLLSLGSGALYRRRALRRAGLFAGARVLDVAVGTGLVAREAVRIAGNRNLVTGIDLSANMLAEARRLLKIPLIRGGAEALPIADRSVDFLSMGYALRHLSDLETAFGEFRRVLRPGGTVLLLEIARPVRALPYAVARLYFGRLVPLFSRLATSNVEMETLMRYYWDTIESCVPPEIIGRVLTQSGFVNVKCETALGIFHSYVGQREQN